MASFANDPEVARPSSEARRSEIAEYLLREAAHLLAVRPPDLDPTVPLVELGLDSIRAVELRLRAEEDLGIELPIASLAADASLADLAAHVLAALDEDRVVPKPAPPPTVAWVSAQPPAARATPVAASAGMRVGVLWFSSSAVERPSDRYGLVLAGARLADARGLDAVWLPERHFHPFGGLFPNPAVLAAALATTTERVRLRAGSVVLPLHDPIRVAEEWSVVDNLSGGRVDLAFAAGRNVVDFVLAPGAYAERRDRTVAALDVVRRLWRGDAIRRTDGVGRDAEVRVYPRPVQEQPGIWLTTSGPADVFELAGALGANVLTGLIHQSVEELGSKVAVYRAAHARHGHAGPGEVTVMLHTYLDEDLQRVREKVRGPFTDYLRSFVELWAGNDEQSRFAEFPERRRREMLDFAFERYFQRSALFGTVDRGLQVVQGLAAVGVTEIASLVDFGLRDEDVLDGLERLAVLRERLATRTERAGA